MTIEQMANFANDEWQWLNRDGSPAHPSNGHHMGYPSSVGDLGQPSPAPDSPLDDDISDLLTWRNGEKETSHGLYKIKKPIGKNHHALVYTPKTDMPRVISKSKNYFDLAKDANKHHKSIVDSTNDSAYFQAE